MIENGGTSMYRTATSNFRDALVIGSIEMKSYTIQLFSIDFEKWALRPLFVLGRCIDKI